MTDRRHELEHVRAVADDRARLVAAYEQAPLPVRRLVDLHLKRTGAGPAASATPAALVRSMEAVARLIATDPAYEHLRVELGRDRLDDDDGPRWEHLARAVPAVAVAIAAVAAVVLVVGWWAEIVAFVRAVVLVSAAVLVAWVVVMAAGRRPRGGGRCLGC